jgi:hypothetical protein
MLLAAWLFALVPVGAAATGPTATPAAVAPGGAGPAFDPSVARRMSVPELRRRLGAGERVVILDSRGSTGGSMIASAVHVPSADLAGWAAGKPRDALIVTYCA